MSSVIPTRSVAFPPMRSLYRRQAGAVYAGLIAAGLARGPASAWVVPLGCAAT
jgi:hypothetical protein